MRSFQAPVRQLRLRRRARKSSRYRLFFPELIELAITDFLIFPLGREHPRYRLGAPARTRARLPVVDHFLPQRRASDDHLLFIFAI